MTHLSLYVQVTWQEARRICVSNSADLASISSESERKFAYALAGKGETWVGGNDIKTEGVWTWTDGTPWVNSFWYPGEPNNRRGNQDCATLADRGNGLFDDGTCTFPRKFICKGMYK